MQIDEAGVALNERGMADSDGYGCTNVSHIYVVGDAKHQMAATFGMEQARIAALHATSQDVQPFDWSVTPICFALNPQIVQLGTISGDTISVHRTPYSDCVFPHINFDTDGFLKLAWNADGIIVGGVAAGRQATEAIAPLSMAVQLKLSLKRLAGMQGPHPTLSELPFIAARQALASSVQVVGK